MADHIATPNTPSMLSIRGVTKQFGSVEVLRGISLEIASGEFLTILGESGSGKTTLLRLLAGFEQPSRGEIWMAGERIDPLPPNRRRLNTVFQSYALFPHLSVFENVAYGLRLRKLSECEIRSRVGIALTKASIQQLAEYPPAKISGGQQQRVEIGRAHV
jgi:spermidine/putrescine transport system ATP-binding protein